jgi:hypothetical protein
MPPIYRAPMRARDRDDVPAGAGAEFGLEHGVVGIGDALPDPPATFDAAVTAAVAEHGEKAGKMLRRFAELPADSFVWTRTTDGMFHLGRITGGWRYNDSPAAGAVGIHHVRPTRWLDRPFGAHDVPVAVAETFGRGGRNLQRTQDEWAERRTVDLWDEDP